MPEARVPTYFSRDGFGKKDFDRFAYFVSKADNKVLVVKPRHEEIALDGEVRVAKHEETGKRLVGLKIIFSNGMIQFEYEPKKADGTTVDEKQKKINMMQINYLRDVIKREDTGQEKDRQIKEVKKPAKIYSESEVADIEKKHAEEIAALKKQNEPAPDEAPSNDQDDGAEGSLEDVLS